MEVSSSTIAENSNTKTFCSSTQLCFIRLIGFGIKTEDAIAIMIDIGGEFIGKAARINILVGIITITSSPRGSSKSFNGGIMIMIIIFKRLVICNVISGKWDIWEVEWPLPLDLFC